MEADHRGVDGRRRSFTELARRAQLVDEAIRALAELGYANASLGQIARRLKISKGVISYHFTNKEELLEQVVQEVIRQSAGYVNPAVEAAGTAHERLTRIIQRNLSYLQTHLDHILALREIANVKTAPARQGIRIAHRNSLAAVEEVLKEGQRTGEFRDFSPRAMAITIKAALDVVPPLVASDPSFDLDLYASELADLFTAATTRVRSSPR